MFIFRWYNHFSAKIMHDARQCIMHDVYQQSTIKLTEDKTMLNRVFAAEYFYFNFTFIRGKVDFAAMR